MGRDEAVSAMLTGTYPREVPDAYRLPPKALESEATMPRFVDVARDAGLGEMSIAGGTIAEDFDGDGLIDVAMSSVDFCAPLRLYRNRGDGAFEDRTEAAQLAGQLGGLNLAATDYNNDGRPDIFVLRGGWEIAMRNSLLRNNADGTFTDVTSEAGLSSGQHATHHAAWADFDNDGWLDVFVGHELTPSQLFRNRGDGTFEDVTARAGVGATAFTKGIAAGDLATRLDPDTEPDLAPLSHAFNNMADRLAGRLERDRRFAADVSHELRSPLQTLEAAVSVVVSGSVQLR